MIFIDLTFNPAIPGSLNGGINTHNYRGNIASTCQGAFRGGKDTNIFAI